MNIWRRVATGTGIASERTREGEGLCFVDFREGRVGEGGLDETENSSSRKGSKKFVEVTVTSACEEICFNCG